MFILEEVLAPSDADPSAGFSLHIADILVQELISACEDSPVPAPALQVRSEFSRGSARAHEVLIVARQASLLPVLGVWHGNDVQRGGRGGHGGLNHAVRPIRLCWSRGATAWRTPSAQRCSPGCKMASLSPCSRVDSTARWQIWIPSSSPHVSLT